MTSQGQSAQGTVVLVELDGQGAVGGFLENQGFRVLRPRDGLDALRTVHEEQPDLLIVSGEIALRSGQTVVSTARRTHQGQQLPIILLGDGPGDDGDAKSADFYLRRPFQMHQLLSLIESLRVNGSYARPKPGQPVPKQVGDGGADLPRRGKLDTTPFADLFAEYWKRTASGVMALKAGSTIRRIDFSNGFPVAARSNLVTEHLLRFLLRLGFISPETYRKLLPDVQGRGWDPVDHLVGSGAVSLATLTEAQEKLVREIVLQCFKWQSAAYRFSAKGVPANKGGVVNLNPLELYHDWVSDPGTLEELNRRATRVAGAGLKANERFSELRHLLQPLMHSVPVDAGRFDGTITFSSIVDSSEHEEETKSALITLIEMGLVDPVPVERPARRRARSLPPASGEKKFERIRQMVREDQARIGRAKNAFAVLGLAGGSGTAEVTARFQRFCRFYKPENFERIGDSELATTARELIAAFRNAATEILGTVPADLPLSNQKRTTKSKEPERTRDEEVLAEVFFDDGSTYLKLEDIQEALYHFKRCVALVPESPRFLSYSGWCTYLLGKDDPAEVADAKQTLLAALQLDSKNDRALYFLGCLYDQGGKVDRAVDCWRKAAKLNQDNYEAQAALRRVKEMGG